MTDVTPVQRPSAAHGSTSMRTHRTTTGTHDQTGMIARRGLSHFVPARLRGRGQAGLVLTLVLAFTLVGTLLSLAILTFGFTGTRAVPAYQGRIDEMQMNSDAMNLAIQLIRTDMTKGLDGASSTYTYGPVSVTCLGDPGSGAAIAGGQADRTVSCATTANELEAQVRFLDRGGSKAGVLAEVLSWTQAG
jgi:hypothetical protein